MSSDNSVKSSSSIATIATIATATTAAVLGFGGSLFMANRKKKTK
jgi:hypothetical protein